MRYCFQLSDIQDSTQLTQYATFETVCGETLAYTLRIQMKNGLILNERNLEKKTIKLYFEMSFKSNLPPRKSIQNFILQEQINNKIIYINYIPGSIISIPKIQMVTTLYTKRTQEINFDQLVSTDKSTNKL